ncbi:MAG: hypothetical protein O2955_05065 [Planctomycetota bacterium]|nr:hypothetical protein [Planctomycetota bacterium]
MMNHDRSNHAVISLLWVCGFLLMLVSVTSAEVRPTGRDEPLFRERLFESPAQWHVKRLPTGRDFHLATYYSSFSSTVEGSDGPMPFSEIPWANQAIVRVSYDELKNPEIFNDLLHNKTNPIMFFGYGHYMEPYKYPGRTPSEIDDYFKLVVAAQEAFGPRFLCLDYCEWSWGGVSRDEATSELTESIKLLNLPLPKDRDTATEWWNATYDLAFKRYQDAGVPILSWNATSLNHYETRKGASYTGNEIAYVNAANDSVKIAFCRGAARQYGTPWGMYAAGFGGHFGHNTFTYTRSPDERRFRDGRLYGAYSAVPLQEQRRTLFTTYMAGANFQLKESDSAQGMVSTYDPRTVDDTEPRVLALQDEKTYAGPYASLCSDLWDNVVTKHDRGTPYTPLALMFDKHHGFAFKYSRTLTVGALPYTTADNQMRAVMNTAFPNEGDQYAAGPFGEMFDVITTEASASTIDSYRAVVLAGPVRIDDRLADVLKDFVENGGLLFLACEQMTPALWTLAGINETGELGEDSMFLRAHDFYVYQQGAYKYHKVTLDGAEPLFLANNYDDRQWPIATINRVGTGGVIVGTPVWMNVADDPATMHGVFSEVLTMIADEVTPVAVRGNEVKVMYNRSDIGWVVTLMNNRGTTIAHPGFKPAIRDHDVAGVVLRPKFGYVRAKEWLTDQTWDDSSTGETIGLTIPPGEIRIVEFTTK